jgi:hypothetical protein
MLGGMFDPCPSLGKLPVIFVVALVAVIRNRGERSRKSILKVLFFLVSCFLVDGIH